MNGRSGDGSGGVAMGSGVQVRDSLAAGLISVVCWLAILGMNICPVAAVPDPSGQKGGAVVESNSKEVPPVEILEALWKALKDNYPMMEYMGAWDDEWLEEFRPLVKQSQDRQAAFELMDELVCRLNDYHTRLDWPGRHEAWNSPAIHVEMALDGSRDVPAVVEAAPGVPVRPGDEVVAVDGVPAAAALETALKHSVGSTEAARKRAACWRMLLGRADQPLNLTLRSSVDGDTHQVSIPRNMSLPERPVVSCQELGGVPVIGITQWSDSRDQKVVDAFDRLLEQYRSRPYLVIDVRGNGGGLDEMADEVTGRFLKNRIISSIFFERLAPSMEYRRMIEWAHPRGPWRYEGRFAVLTDEGCKSACEHFVSGMLEAGAYLAGTPTDGAGGWIRRVELPGDATVYISRTFPLHGKDPSPLHGVLPHALVRRTLQDLRQGRDSALEAAISWLKSGEPLPSHPQRLARG